MTARQPTPQGIAALLRRAGFERGISRPESLAAAGYAVIPNIPGDGIVLVSWWSADAAERTGRCAEMLGRYTTVLAAAGFDVLMSDGGGYLIVTAKVTEPTTACRTGRHSICGAYRCACICHHPEASGEVTTNG